jgi:site-specific DNA-methyltransferase (adenine-specific)
LSRDRRAAADWAWLEEPGSEKVQKIGPSARLLLGDAFEILPRLPAGRFHMIFADPPYFLSGGGITCKSGRMVSVDKGDWDRPEGFAKAYEFTRGWLSLCRTLLARDGTIWVSGTRHIIHIVGYAMQELGYKLLNEIIWHKRNAPPNLSCRYFTHSTETILWAARSEKSRHTFNYEAMKEQNEGKQMRNVWDIAPPKKNEKRYGKHPTQKPEALLERIIEASTEPGKLVLDPFCGSGTTGVAALRLGRLFVGIDSSADYLSVAGHRLLDETDAASQRRLW